MNYSEASFGVSENRHSPLRLKNILTSMVKITILLCKDFPAIFFNEKSNFMAKQPDKPNKTASSDFEVSDDGFEKYKVLMENRQNMAFGIAGGAGAAVVGTIVWAEVVQLTGYKLDWMALAIGFLIGYAIRFFGKAVAPSPYGYVAGALALCCSLTGNLLTACIMFSHIKKVSFFTLLTQLNLTSALYFLRAVIGPFDVIFCLGAIFLAYYFSFKRIKG
jgi:hypothetical protein